MGDISLGLDHEVEQGFGRASYQTGNVKKLTDTYSRIQNKDDEVYQKVSYSRREDREAAPIKSGESKSSWTKWVIIGLIALVVIGIAAGVVYFLKFRKPKYP